MSKDSKSSTTKGKVPVPKKQAAPQKAILQKPKPDAIKLAKPKTTEEVIPLIAKKKKSKVSPEDQPLWDFAGDALSGMAKKALSHGLNLLTGFGDYDVVTNSLLRTATGGENAPIPIMSNSKVANVIRHREFIGDVYSSTSVFDLTSYELNPGLDGTFPWLAPIANCYTNYRIRGMVMEFVSQASELATTPAIGYVAMATQYNSLDTPFVDKKTMENSEYANSGKISENLCHPIECAKNQLSLDELYIRNNLLPANADKKFYDQGVFNIAVGGQSASDVVIGELWATYEIEFFFPKLGQTATPAMNATAFRADAGITNAVPLGTNGSYGTSSTFRFTQVANTLIFPPETFGQSFMLIASWTGNVVTPIYPNFSTTGGISSFGGQLNSPQGGLAGVARMTQINWITIANNSPNPTVVFGTAGTLPTGSPILNIYCIQIPAGLSSTDLPELLSANDDFFSSSPNHLETILRKYVDERKIGEITRELSETRDKSPLLSGESTSRI